MRTADRGGGRRRRRERKSHQSIPYKTLAALNNIAEQINSLLGNYSVRYSPAQDAVFGVRPLAISGFPSKRKLHDLRAAIVHMNEENHRYV